MFNVFRFDPATMPEAVKPSGPNAVTIMLHAWKDTSGVIRYMYTPTGSVNFLTTSSTQTITIELDPVTINSFAIAGFTSRTKSKHVDGQCRKQGGQYGPFPNSDIHKAPLSMGDNYDGLQLKLGLADKERTYFTVLLWDKSDSSLIDCDPQAENGTGT